MEGRVPLESISGTGILSALKSKRVLSRRQYLCKRVFDLGFSITVLILFAPFGLLIAILIKLVSEGTDIFFSTPSHSGREILHAL